MRNSALTIAAVLMLAAPAAAHAGDRGKLTSREARSAAHGYLTTQTKALQHIPGLSVAATRVSGPVDRVGPRTMIVPTTFALRWDDGRTFICQNRIWLTKRGRSIRIHPANFDC